MDINATHFRTGDMLHALARCSAGDQDLGMLLTAWSDDLPGDAADDAAVRADATLMGPEEGSPEPEPSSSDACADFVPGEA